MANTTLPIDAFKFIYERGTVISEEDGIKCITLHSWYEVNTNLIDSETKTLRVNEISFKESPSLTKHIPLERYTAKHYLDYLCVETVNDEQVAMFGVYKEGEKGLVDYGTWEHCVRRVEELGGKKIEPSADGVTVVERDGNWVRLSDGSRLFDETTKA